MKFSTLAALSSSCALLAIAQPVVQDKRAVVYETYVTEVVQTEYEFVTVWVTPGQNAVQEAKTTSSSSQHNHEDYHINLKSSSSSVTPAAVSVAPVSVTPVSVTPVSVTPVSVTPVSVTPVEVSVTPVSVTPVEVSVTPVSFSPVQVSVTPVSVTPVSVTPVSVTPVSVTPVVEQPAPTSTAATNNYGTTTGGGACNEIGGHCAGDATFYDVYPDQWTACGTHVDGLKEDIFAIAEGEIPSRILRL